MPWRTSAYGVVFLDAAPHTEVRLKPLGYGKNFRFGKAFVTPPGCCPLGSPAHGWSPTPPHPPTCPLLQFMEQRKRPHVEGSDTVYPKKRAALDSNGTPSHVNGLSHPDEPKDGDNLEVQDLLVSGRMDNSKLNCRRCSARMPSSVV